MQVVIVGAGPSGLLLSLLLSKHGIPCEILEASYQLDQQPRAAIYGPPCIPDLKRAGIIDQVRTRGINPTTISWRRPKDFAVITNMVSSPMQDVNGEDFRTACLVLDQLDQLMLDEYLEKYNGKISWNHKVVGVGQDEKQAWVDVETSDGNKKVYGDYIVGCDGANSIVRRSLFGTEFPGFTWDAQIVATNVRPSQ